MRKIGFIGAYDKTDFIMYLAKILVEVGQKVLLVDGTLTQKAKYIVPVIKPSRTYITEFEGIDVAVGFNSFENIKEYLALPKMAELSYDIALVDVDTVATVESYELETFEQIYFVTSFDMYSIKRGLESISGLKEPINVTKVLFSRKALREENEYLDFLSLGSKIVWQEEAILFPFELGDQTVIYNNQRVSKIKFKKLSNQYKEGLMYLATKVAPDVDERLIRRAFMKIERGV